MDLPMHGMKFYHVCQCWDGGDLMSLLDQHNGDESAALEEFAARWPEAGELGVYHISYIHLWDSLDQAEQFQSWFGGEILEINGDDLEIERDSLEFDHPITRDIIPKTNIRRKL